MSITNFSITLGPRLACVASYVPNMAKLGDIGTDHAYLPIFLSEKGFITSAVAVDVHERPYRSALATVLSRGLNKSISIRLGDGLAPVRPGEVDVLTIAGMGGNTMLEILAAGPEVLQDVKALVLQPQGAEAKVRYTLLDSGWLLKNEQLVEEDGHLYVIMAYSRTEGLNMSGFRKEADDWAAWAMNADPGLTDDFPEALLWQFGPMLIKKPDPLLKRLFNDRIDELNYRLLQMRKGKNHTVLERIKKNESEKKWCEIMANRLFSSERNSEFRL